MSSKEKKQQFRPGEAPTKAAAQDLPQQSFAAERGVEAVGFQAEKGQTGPVDGYKLSEATKDYVFKGIVPGKTFLHPPTRLIEGRIVYRAKFYGHMIVKDPRGAQVVREATNNLKAAAKVFRANNPGENLKIVDLSISVRGVTCINQENKDVLHQHPIHSISFSADDKRDKVGNMLAYIARGPPPARNNICYVFEVKPKQAKDVVATIGQAFELAYKRYLDAKKTQSDFEKLRQVYHQSSGSEKESIRKQLDELKMKLLKYMAQDRQNSKPVKVDPSYRPSHSGAAPVAVREDTSLIKMNTDDPGMMAGIESKAEEMNLDAKLKAIKKDEEESPVDAKWEKVLSTTEPFDVEPSLNPDTQYLVPRFQTTDLDQAISEISIHISEAEEAFSWRKSQSPLSDKNIDMTPFSHPLLDSVGKTLKEIEATAADLPDIPDMPSNYVMDEFLKAREKATMPKEGTVKGMASSWYKEHHD